MFVCQNSVSGHRSCETYNFVELYKFTSDKKFKNSKSMGDIISASFDFVKNHYLKVDLYNLFQ